MRKKSCVPALNFPDVRNRCSPYQLLISDHKPNCYFLGIHLDILAISCDSFNEGTNIEIGRCQGNKNHLSTLCRIREWCRNYQVAFKINTMVNTHNWEEDMSQEILDLNPVRWKVQLKLNPSTLYIHSCFICDRHFSLEGGGDSQEHLSVQTKKSCLWLGK